MKDRQISKQGSAQETMKGEGNNKLYLLKYFPFSRKPVRSGKISPNTAVVHLKYCIEQSHFLKIRSQGMRTDS